MTQYQEEAGPVLVPTSAAAPTGFRSTFPDLQPGRPAAGLSVVAQAAFFAVFAISTWAVPKLSWSAEYPDFAPAPASIHASRQPAFFTGSARSAWPYSPSEASAAYPDRVEPARGLHASGQQAIAWEPLTLGGFQSSVDKWGPSYADRIDRPTLLAAGQQAFAFDFALPQLPYVASEARAVFPDRIDRAPALPTAEQQSVAYVPALAQWPYVPSAADAVFPDFARAAPGLPANEQQATAYVPAISTWAVPALGWKGAQDDFARGQGVHASQQQALAWEPLTIQGGFSPFVDKWLPTNVDRVERPTFPAAEQQVEPFLAAIPQWPYVPSSARAIFPDRIDAAQSIPAHSQQFLAYVPARAQWPYVSSEAKATFPDSVPAAAGLLPGAQQAIAWEPLTLQGGFQPFVDKWLPTNVDRVDRPQIITAEHQALAYQPALSSWPYVPGAAAATFPDFARAAAGLPIAEQQFLAYTPAVSTWAVPPLGWKGTQDDFARSQSLQTVAQPFLSWEPRTLPGGFQPFVDKWAPTNVDRIERPVFIVAEQQAIAYTPARSTWAVLSPSWQGVYPDAIDRKIEHASAQPFIAYQPARDRWPYVASEARAFFPDFVRPSLSLSTPAQQFLGWNPATPVYVPPLLVARPGYVPLASIVATSETLTAITASQASTTLPGPNDTTLSGSQNATAITPSEDGEG